jgi:hypothetical protein
MAITAPIANPAVTETRRTSRATIEVQRNAPGEFAVYREKLGLDAEGNVVWVEQNQVAVRRGFAQIAEETVTLGDGTELTGDDVVEALSKMFDRWADEDAGSAAQPASPPMAPSPMMAPPPPPKPNPF